MVQHVSEFFENGFENAFKKDKEELQKRSNTASQPYNGTQTMQDQNHRNTNSYHWSNNKRYDQFNNIQSENFKRYHHQSYKKKFFAKNHQLIIIHIIKIAIIATKYGTKVYPYDKI